MCASHSNPVSYTHLDVYKRQVQPVKTKKKLSRADKKQIEAAIARANRTDKKGKSAESCALFDNTDADNTVNASKLLADFGGYVRCVDNRVRVILL